MISASRFGYGVLSFGQAPRTPAPDKPDPRARLEMEAYDALPPETRQLVRDSANDVSLGDKLQAVRQRGAPRPILTRLQKRGLIPYQVGEAGIVAEMVLDEFDQASAE